MKRYILFVVAATLIYTVILLVLSRGGQNILTKAYVTTNRYKEAVTDSYNIGFQLDDKNIGSMNTYIVRYRPTSLETARHYGALLGFSEDCTETEQYFYFKDDAGVLFVYKNINSLQFIPNELSYKQPVDISNASTLAEEFMESKLLFNSYEEAIIDDMGSYFSVRFVNRLDRVKNLGFTNTVRFDKKGKILGLDYYFVFYERVGSFDLKTMKEAFYELPVVEGDPLELTGCSLVYYYQDSIIQPCYLFEGKMADGTVFREAVRAAYYR